MLAARRRTYVVLSKLDNQILFFEVLGEDGNCDVLV